MVNAMETAPGEKNSEEPSRGKDAEIESVDGDTVLENESIEKLEPESKLAYVVEVVDGVETPIGVSYEVDKKKFKEAGLTHDELLSDRANEVDKKMSNPLPDELLQDVDQEVINWSNTDDGKEAIDHNKVVEFEEELIDEEGHPGKSMDEVFESIGKLDERAKGEKIKAIKVFGTAMRREAGDEKWVDMDEGAKQQVRLAEEIQLRALMAEGQMHVEQAQAGEKLDDHTREKLELNRKMFEDYIQGDDVRSKLKADLEFTARQLKKFRDDNLVEEGSLGEAQEVVKKMGDKVAEMDDQENERVRQGIEGMMEDTGVVNMSEAEGVEVAGAVDMEVESQEAVGRIDTENEEAVEEVLTSDLSEEEKQASGLNTESQSVEQEGGMESSKKFEGTKVLGKEGISREDMAGMRKQLGGLLADGTPEGAFAAVKQLAALRRSGVALSGEGVEKYRKQLLVHGEAMRKQGPQAVARYHMYLKYLKMENQLSSEDAEVIRIGLVDRTTNQRGDLSNLAIKAKYLGVIEDGIGMRKYLQEDMSKTIKKGEAEQIAFEMARRRYLNEPSALPEEQRHWHERIDKTLEKYKEQGDWQKYARLRSAVDYERGVTTLDEADKEGLAGQVNVCREEAKENDNWMKYAEYMGDIKNMEKRSVGMKGNQERIVRAKEDVRFLAGLERRNDLDGPREYLRKLGEQHRAEMGDPVESRAEVKESEKVETAKVELLESVIEDIDPEQYPGRAKFEQQIRDHEAGGEDLKEQQRAGGESKEYVDEDTWQRKLGRVVKKGFKGAGKFIRDRFKGEDFEPKVLKESVVKEEFSVTGVGPKGKRVKTKFSANSKEDLKKWLDDHQYSEYKIKKANKKDIDSNRDAAA